MVRKAKLKTRQARRQRRHKSIRKKIFGTPARPRLVVYRSLKNLEGQLVSDLTGETVVGVSTLAPELEERVDDLDELTKTEQSKEAGKLLAERAVEEGIEKVVFDRGGYKYHGRVEAFAEGAREGGLDF